MHLWLASLAAAAHLMAVSPVVQDTNPIATRGRATPCANVEVDSTLRTADTVQARPMLDATEWSIANALAIDARLLPVDEVARDTASADTTHASRRPRAIEYSDAYHTRLKIHQIGAYLMFPLFIGEYVLGQKLLTSTNRSGSLKTAHSAVAAGVGVVFVANTVTGAWNFWDARKDPNGRTRRTIHSALMLASDIGILWTAASAGNAKRSLQQARHHRAIALGSISLSAIGAGMMWLWKD
jgi:hypothetical protein